MATYPPTGLSENVKTLPEWIQKGCGNDEYICEEKVNRDKLEIKDN